MGVVVASGTAVSVAANTTSSDQVSGTYQFAPFDGVLLVTARGSATGMSVQLFSDGQTLANSLSIPYTGTAGAISVNDHTFASFPIAAGSRTEFKLVNTTGGSLTTDYILTLEPIE